MVDLVTQAIYGSMGLVGLLGVRWAVVESVRRRRGLG